MFVVRRASFCQEFHVIPELHNLLEEHWNEVGLGPASDKKLEINERYFEILERNQGYLPILILHEATNEVAGYLSVFVSSHQHLQSVIVASTDCFFIRKKFRGISATKALLKAFKMAEEITKTEFRAEYFQFIYNTKVPQDKLAKYLDFEVAN